MLEDDATINRGRGSLSGEPVFLGHVNVNYLENATTVRKSFQPAHSERPDHI
jgi:hypothetical protein